MKRKLLRLFLVIVALSACLPAQVLPARDASPYNADNYAFWTARVSPGSPTGSGTQTFQIQTVGGISLQNGRTLQLFAVDAPILIGTGSVQETATPTAVSGCNIVGNQLGQCNVTFTGLANSHGPGDLLQSGTMGLQEALNDCSGFFANTSTGGGGVVVVDYYWSFIGGTQAFINAAIPFSNCAIEDKRMSSAGYQMYAARPTGSTFLPAGLAPTDSAATGGSMTSGTHRIMYEYMDINGQLGKQSAELADGNSRTGLIINAPAASTGAVAWIPCVTANGGATKTEKCFMGAALTASICTLSKLTPVPGCALANTTYGQTGSAATILADVATTAPFVFGNSNLTAANDTGYQASSTTAGYVPVPASSAYLPFSPVYFSLATAAASNSTYEVMAWNLPAGFFNVLAKKWNFCLSYHATSAANSETLTLNLRYGNYQNSDTVLIPLVTTAYSSTNVVDGKACADITTAVLGASGTLNVHGQLVTNLAGTAALTWFTEATAANAATGVIGSLPLTTNNQLTLEAVIGTGALGSAITFDSISLEPVN